MTSYQRGDRVLVTSKDGMAEYGGTVVREALDDAAGERFYHVVVDLAREMGAALVPASRLRNQECN